LADEEVSVVEGSSKNSDDKVGRGEGRRGYIGEFKGIVDLVAIVVR
jgi:hypothetical protein